MLPSYKKQVLTRLKRACGQLEAVGRMVESDAYCMDVMHQTLAVNGALKKINALIMESHLNSCAADRLSSPNAAVKNKAVREIIEASLLANK